MSFSLFIPTRDSARWIGQFLIGYRAIGVEPLYIVDTRSADDTLDILTGMGARVVPFTPSQDFVEAGMIEFGARQAATDWVLRLDDDEFPTRAMIAWASQVGARSFNQAWINSRRELFFDGGRVVYNRAPTRYTSLYRRDVLHPQIRLFNARRVTFLQQVHSAGFDYPAFFDFAPDDAFFIHCNCLLRSQSERLEKVLKYESIRPKSAFKVADEYLPELFPPSHNRPATDGLEEFGDLLRSLPIADTPKPALSPETERALTDAVAGFASDLYAIEALPFHNSADRFRWIRHIPRPLRREIAKALSSVGEKTLAGYLWHHLNVTEARKVTYKAD